MTAQTIPALIVTVGISGSGKSTWARSWVAQDPANIVRVNRDDLRAMMFPQPDYSPAQEEMVTTAQQSMVESLVLMGKQVVIDNTNLHPLDMKNWTDMGKRLNVPVLPRMFKIDVEDAKINVAKRVKDGGLHVPDHVIEAQAAKLQKFAQQQ